MSSAEIREYFASHIQAIEKSSNTLIPTIELCCEIIVECLMAGKKILVMGNGGSAADAQHLAAEFIGRFLLERKALPAIALTTDTSILTAVGNDYGFDEIFKRQIEGLADPGDVVIGISTSGNSTNVEKGIRQAKIAGCKTIGLLGKDGGVIAGMVDVNLTVPVYQVPHVQETHLTIIHILCGLVERALFDSAAADSGMP